MAAFLGPIVSISLLGLSIDWENLRGLFMIATQASMERLILTW